MNEKKIKLWPFLVIVSIDLVTFNVRAQDIQHYCSVNFSLPLSYIVYKTPDPLKIDGKALEIVWNNISWSSEFADIEGQAKPTPELKTRFKALWDDQNLYIFAELEEPHIWATLAGRDQIVYHDNDFEIFIDPDGDSYRYFEMEVNALGTLFDLFLDKPYRDGGEALVTWDVKDIQIGVDIDGTVSNPMDTDKKWCVEIAIPFKSLVMGKEPNVPVDGSTWRVNFSRVEWESEVVDDEYRKKIDPETDKLIPEHNWVWSPQGLINMHYPERWGYFQFSSETIGTRAFTFKLPDEEPVKRRLWSVYYLQAGFFKRNGRYAKDLDSLCQDYNSVADNNRYDISMESTAHQFQVICRRAGSQEAWCIDHTGRLRKFSTTKNW